MRNSVLVVGLVLLMGLVVEYVFTKSESRLRVSAASSLRAVIEERLAETDLSSDIVLKTAGSQQVVRQILAGEAVDLVALAHPDWIAELVKNGFVSQKNRTTFLINRLVVVGSSGREPPLESWEEFTEYSGRLAVGSVESVPVGIYARQALEAADIWEKVENNHVGFTNVSFVLNAVASGHLPLGIVYRSDLNSSDFVRYLFDIPARYTPDIIYQMAVLNNSPASRKLFKIFTDEKAQKIYRQHGFEIP